MKFLIDADSPYSLIRVFKDFGHEAVHVKDILKYSEDDKIFEYANKNNYIIVTKDLGFAKMFMKNKGIGLVLIRLPYYFTSVKINENVSKFLKAVDFGELMNSIIVVEVGRYRVRKFR